MKTNESENLDYIKKNSHHLNHRAKTITLNNFMVHNYEFCYSNINEFRIKVLLEYLQHF